MTALIGSIQLRGDTAANWAAANPVLLLNEKAIESDTGREKNGDGVSTWNQLPYVGGGVVQQTGLISGGAITVGVFGGNNVRVAAASWYIDGFGVFSTSGNSDFSCAVAAAGQFRYDGFFGKNDGTIIKVTGAESSAAAFPATPADHALIGYVLISDASVSSTPDLSGYLLKSDKASAASVAAGTADDEYVTPKGLADSGAYATKTGAETLTNKRVTPRVGTVASSATPTINTDNVDCFSITALATNITSMTTNLSGTPTNFQPLIIRIKDNGSARTIAWGASFEAKGTSLPTTTVISKVLTVAFLYDTVTSKWGCVGSQQEA